jgi:hypothetical protein
MSSTKSVVMGTVLSLVALAAGGAVTPPCKVPQSPRNVASYDGASDQSIVLSISESQKTLTYRPRGSTAEPETLYLCGQHYHVPVEDVQGCAGEAVVTTPPATAAPWVPAPGQWIEVHTVYSSAPPKPPCNPESLACCTGKTNLVLGFSAKVVSGGSTPILTPPARKFAEWSGSNTGPDNLRPTDCKETAVEWSFRLGCTFTVGQNQLKYLPGGPQGARALQGGISRVKPDLFLVTPKR